MKLLLAIITYGCLGAYAVHIMITSAVINLTQEPTGVYFQGILKAKRGGRYIIRRLKNYSCLGMFIFRRLLFHALNQFLECLIQMELNKTNHQPTMVFSPIDELACVEDCMLVLTRLGSDRTAQTNATERESPYPFASSCLLDMR